MISNVTHLPDSCLSVFVFPQHELLQSFLKPPCSRMTKSSRSHKKQRLQTSRGCRTLCCSCRLSVSSSSEEAEGAGPERFATISSLAHAMVQERLDQMIRERQEARHRSERARRQRGGRGEKQFVVMVAMEKSSRDPREDFRESMVEMITVNKIDDPKDLRRLLNYYISMNSDEHRGLILEVFHDVCTRLFLCCKCH